MQSFKDTKDRAWDVDITVATVKRVRRLTEIDLLGILSGSELFKEFVTDPIKLVDVLFAIVQPQAEKLGISDVDFGEAMAGDAIDNATKAFLEALVNFVPSPKQRENLRALLKAANEVADKAAIVVAERIKATKTRLESEVSSFGESSPVAPASVE